MMTFTFSNGKTVELRRVPPMLMVEIRRNFPPPEPPLQMVDYGDGEKRAEVNPADPAHQQALQDYQLALNDRIIRLLIKRGVIFDLDAEQLAELAELRAFWQAEYGAPLGTGDDRFDYVQYVLVSSPQELEELIGALTTGSQPTEAVTRAAQDTFRR